MPASSHQPRSRAGPAQDRAARWSLGAAVGAALAASACCIGPLLLAAAGVGGAAAFEGLSAYRPLFLGLTALAIAGAFYFAYRKPACADGACASAAPRRKAAKVGVWLLALVAALVAAWPSLAASLLTAPASAAAPAAGSSVTFRVAGLDCDSCIVPIRAAVEKAGGATAVTMSLEAQTVTVRFDPATGNEEAYAAAIEELGYEPTRVGD